MENSNPSPFQVTTNTEPSSCTEKSKALLQLLKAYTLAHMVQLSDVSGFVLGLDLLQFGSFMWFLFGFFFAAGEGIVVVLSFFVC